MHENGAKNKIVCFCGELTGTKVKARKLLVSSLGEDVFRADHKV
jgi:hypothetical protein